MPSSDVDTRLSSTFIMVQKAYCVRRILHTTMRLVPDLIDNIMSDQNWETAATIRDFLQSAASVTKCKSDSTYITLRLRFESYEYLKINCQKHIDIKTVCSRLIVEYVTAKLKKNDHPVCGELPILSRILDVWFGKDIIRDSKLLREYIALLFRVTREVRTASTRNSTNSSTKTRKMTILKNDNIE